MTHRRGEAYVVALVVAAGAYETARLILLLVKILGWST